MFTRKVVPSSNGTREDGKEVKLTEKQAPVPTHSLLLASFYVYTQFNKSAAVFIIFTLRPPTASLCTYSLILLELFLFAPNQQLFTLFFHNRVCSFPFMIVHAHKLTRAHDVRD